MIQFYQASTYDAVLKGDNTDEELVFVLVLVLVPVPEFQVGSRLRISLEPKTCCSLPLLCLLKRRPKIPWLWPYTAPRHLNL